MKRMKCTKCDQMIPNESVFCLYCGAKVKNESDYQKAKPRKITIERPKRFGGCALIYQIMCDGQVIASVRNGETKVFEIDERAHVIQCCATSPDEFITLGDSVLNTGGTTVSDVVNIPSGVQSAELVVKPGFISLKLELVRLY